MKSILLKSIVTGILTSVFFISCDTQVGKWIEDYRKKQIVKRYGEKAVSREQIEDWQKEVMKYRAKVEEKIEAGQKAGKLYRLIGESFAKIESYQLCAENLENAVAYGYHSAEVFYWLGVCYGNLAKTHGWDYEYTEKAEKNFLKSLALPDKKLGVYIKSKFQLALLYFYGFGSNNPYRVNADFIQPSQMEFRNQAVRLMTEYQNDDPGDVKSYFALAGMHKIMGNIPSAAAEMDELMRYLEKKFPKQYQKIPEYQKAKQNYSLLVGIKQ